MSLKIWAISLYVVGIYSLSIHFPELKMLFYPTLGAFSLLFISRGFDLKYAGSVMIGACLASLIGTTFYMMDLGALSLFLDMIITGWMIHRFRWNAPPILAVSMIPFFAHATSLWLVPVSVLLSLAGLLATLSLVYALETKWPVSRALRSKRSVSVTAEPE